MNTQIVANVPFSGGSREEVLGKILRHHRENLNLSQEVVAARLHVSRQVIGNIERGKVRPTWCLILDFASAVGIENLEILRV